MQCDYIISIDDFKTAVEHERTHAESMLKRLFTYAYGIRAIQQKEYRNPVQMLRSSLQSEQRLLLELPLASNEIDALCLRSNGLEYTLLNSVQPKNHANYALCCAYFYYMTSAGTPSAASIKPFYSRHCYSRPDNLDAATFTNLFLLPEPSLREMFYHFQTMQCSGDSTLTILTKLMNYYEVPYPALLIRCYALGLLDSGETLKELLQVTSAQIQAEFHRLWLDESLLKPTLRDDYARLEQLVKNTGEAYVQEEYLKPRTLSIVLSNMKSIYLNIRRD